MLKSDMVMSFLGLLAGEDEGLLLDVRVGHPNFASSFLFTYFAFLLCVCVFPIYWSQLTHGDGDVNPEVPAVREQLCNAKEEMILLASMYELFQKRLHDDKQFKPE